jgi:hypothetical protein
MPKSKSLVSQPFDPYLAGRILAKLDPASAAIFADVLRLAFDPDQPRDYRGRWSKVGPGAGRSAAARTKPALAQAPPLLSGPKRLPDWKPMNNLRPPGQWNDMTVKFVPKYATNLQTNQPDTGKLTGGSITVTLNGKETFQGSLSKGTGITHSKIPLADVSDRNVYLQAHHGSAVSFRHIEIGAPPTPGP